MIKAAVIGAGSMGRNHVRVYSELDGVRLVGVADPSEAVRHRVAQAYGVRTYADYRKLLEVERPDLLTVAVPSSFHKPVALDVIAAGVSLLVEKPIATTSADARTIIAAARRARVKLAVGHIERFNPAVVELKERLDAGELGTIFEVHSRRLSPFPARITDVGVILDLATHELDVMNYLVSTSVVSIYAETARRLHPSHEDMLLGILRFENGAVGVLDINWLSPVKLRELTLTGTRGMYQVNYLTQDLYFYENGHNGVSNGWDALANLVGVSEGNMTRLALHRIEPLRAELESFVAVVRNGGEPLVGGTEGLAALRLAELLVEAGQSGTILRPAELALAQEAA